MKVNTTTLDITSKNASIRVDIKIKVNKLVREKGGLSSPSSKIF